MVRKIKFRGKDIDTGEWRYGYLSFFYTAGRDKNGFILTDKAQIYSQEAGRCYDVLAETVGQFTGLYDKNMKEIYEDDIIMQRGYSGMHACVVKFDSGAFIIGYHGGSSTLTKPMLIQKNGIVIGNIFDNPNLLNNEKSNIVD